MTDALTEPRTVDNAACTGEVYDQGAQVTRWAPTGADPVLYVSTQLRLAPGRSIRAGMPVCWPWFGPGRAAGMEPMHGFARTSTWSLSGRDDGPEETTFTYRLTSDGATSPHWPYRYTVELRAGFGPTLEVSLTTTNAGDDVFDFEEALHAYLVVGDVHAARLTGLDGKSFFDKVTGAERVQQGDLVIDDETDSVYRTRDPVTLHDPALGRRVVITTEGAGNIVVWNPWATKAAEVPDIGGGDWERFVCVEGANVFENAVTLAPGTSHTMTYRLEVHEL